MTRLASRFGASNLIRRDRPLTREELFRVCPAASRSSRHSAYHRLKRGTTDETAFLFTRRDDATGPASHSAGAQGSGAAPA